jgi:FG-GAP repeat/Divergent InlB B-repeat domain
MLVKSLLMIAAQLRNYVHTRSYAIQNRAATATVGRAEGKMNLAIMTDHALSPYLPTVSARPVVRRSLRLCPPALVWVMLLCLTLPAMAGFTQANVPKLVVSDPIGLARQGFSVAVSADGNTAIVGGPFDNSGAGAAWVFTRSNGTWSQQQKLTGDDLSGAAQLGWSVALSADGKTAIVGGPGDNGSIGAAWVFVRNNNGEWNQQGAKLSGANATGARCAQPGVVGAAEQGYSVAISGDGNTAVVGGWADNNALGAAWVFTSSSGVWSQTVVKLCGTGATDTTNIMQGFSVALSDDGTTAIVGAPNNGEFNGEGTGNGAAWVFKLSSGTWSQQGKLVGTTEICSSSQQGFSVALSRDGNTAIVGGPGKETTNALTAQEIIAAEAIDEGCGTLITKSTSDGAAWVFTRNRSTGEWNPQGGALVGVTQPLSNPGKGFSVALGVDGDTALVGGPTDNANTGATWVFARNSGTWTQQGAKLIGTGAIGAAGQAASLALSRDGNTAIVGGALDQDGTGAAWAFKQLFALTVSDNGSGTITSSQSNIDCTSGTCDASYGGGTMVTLSATPGNGDIFTGWSGACSGTESCIVTMSAAESVTATFAVGLTRTFVSSSGVDSNPCTVAAPCATFAHAFPLTNAGGVVAALDPGKYGPLTITYPVTIDGNGWAAITAVDGGPGITIAAGTSDVIMLRGVTIDGGGQGGPGIYFTSGGSLTVAGCVVRNVSSNGLAVLNNGSTPMTLAVMDSSFINTNTTGAYLASSGSGAVTASFVRTEFSGNGVNGLQLDGTQGTGAIGVTVTNSVAANNFNSGFEVDSNTGQSVSNLTLTQVQSAGNGTGIAATGANATLWLAQSIVAGNAVAYKAQSNAVVINSFGDNSFANNGSGTGSLTPVGKQ